MLKKEAELAFQIVHPYKSWTAYARYYKQKIGYFPKKNSCFPLKGIYVRTFLKARYDNT